jgi:G3E family GTPase
VVVVADTRLVLVTGLNRQATGWVANRLLREEPGTVLVHHDLSALAEGIVHRRVRRDEGDDPVTVLELAHGCVSCTLREDTLPLLHGLVARRDVRRIVLLLDPGVEPEPVCWTLHNALVGDTTIAALASIEAVVAVVDEGDWLVAATGDEALGLTPDDDRTLAQVAVGQVEFADAVVVVGQAEDAWAGARTSAVLDRLAPAAPRAATVRGLLDRLPETARRGTAGDAHDPLLTGCPPLEPDCGVALTVFEARRPFHPARLHQAIDVLLAGVVRARGRVWVATQPDVALWLESAGGGLRVGHAGAWLAAVGDEAWARTTPERRAKAALDWHPRWGDRVQEIAILCHDASPGHLHATLHDALLTDDELAVDWGGYHDPFMHREPMEDKA